jgi:hypothetical protein
MQLPYWLIYTVITIGLSYIVAMVYFFYRTTKGMNHSDKLVQLMILCVLSMVSVWVVDKVLAYKNDLLTETESNSMFDFIKTISLMLFSFYFGKLAKKDNHE